MLIHEKSSSVVFPARDPLAITSAIPKSRIIRYQGVEQVAAFHGVEETVVLNNLGYDVPSPILHRYGWPGQYKPFIHQKATSAFFTRHRRAFCFNGMGTGKTLSVLWLVDFLMREGLVRKALIVSPLSTVKSVWGDAIFWQITHRKSTILTGSAQKRRDLLASDADFYIINHHGVDVIKKELAAKEDIDLVIADELDVYRNSNTDLYRALKLVIKDRRFLALTATPIDDPTDSWALTRLVSPSRVPPYIGAWRRETMNQVSQFRWVPKPDGIKRAFDAMQPAIRFATEDCIDLPPITYTTRECDLSPEQKRAYETMRREMVMEASTSQISAQNAGVQALKLLQIACGAVRTNDGDVHLLDGAPRLSVLDEYINEVPKDQKILVFVPFRAVLESVAEHLRNHHTVEIINGDVAASRRADIFFQFQNTADPRIIVAIPQTMSHGLNLQKASTVIWYGPPPSQKVYTQANGRVARPSQKNHMNIGHIVGSPRETEMYKGLKAGLSLLETLLAMYKVELNTLQT